MSINYLYFWDAYTLYATIKPAAEMHTLTTASLTLSLDGAFRLEAAAGPEDHAAGAGSIAREMRAVFIPPGVAHRVTTPNVRRVVLQLEPGSPRYYALGRLLEARSSIAIDVESLHRDFAELRESLAPAFRRRLSFEEAHAVFHELLRAFAGEAVDRSLAEPASSGLRDERIARVLQDLRAMQELPAGLGASELARSVDLSTERFRRLFKAEMGLPVRRYLLWLRIRRAGAAVTDGASLTEAAHAVGFYDSAHLSRSCKEMLGFPPSFLTGHQVEMVNCAAAEARAGVA